MWVVIWFVWLMLLLVVWILVVFDLLDVVFCVVGGCMFVIDLLVWLLMFDDFVVYCVMEVEWINGEIVWLVGCFGVLVLVNVWLCVFVYDVECVVVCLVWCGDVLWVDFVV